MDNTDRSFTIIHLKSKSKGNKSKQGGRYISKSPLGAAKKAFNRECSTSKIRGVCSLVIILKETTSNSKHKLYRYQIKRSILVKPLVINMNGTEVTIRYKTSGKQLKTFNPKLIKKVMKGGGRKSRVLPSFIFREDMEEDEEVDEGIFTGYYNIIHQNKVIHTDYFLLEEEEDDSEIMKQIMKKHKKDFIDAGVSHGVAIEIFDTMFYPRYEGPNAVREALEYQLPIIREEMAKLNQQKVQVRKRNAFDFSDISAMLDSL